MTRLMLSLCNTARCESSCSWKYGSSNIRLPYWLLSSW